MMKTMIGQESFFVLCVENEGFEVSLEKRKVYRRLEDQTASEDQLIRIVDESGDDYLFPEEYFVAITIPDAASSVFDEVQT